MGNEEIVLMAGVESGNVTLYGQQLALGWRFRRWYPDQTPPISHESETRGDSEWVNGWEEALRGIDRHQWWRLPAIHIHPQFRHLVWTALQARMVGMHGSDAPTVALLRRWRERCGVEADALT